MGSQVFQSIAVKELKIGRILFSSDSNGNLIVTMPGSRGTTKRIIFRDGKGFNVQAWDNSGNRYKKGADKKI